jgi:hypothetical protein
LGGYLAISPKARQYPDLRRVRFFTEPLARVVADRFVRSDACLD